jgi:ribonucleoside-diphosphate reductase beta chain
MQSGHSVSKSPTDLYRIAKRAGVWDPEDIPVAEDARDWQALNAAEREQLLKICSLFYEGEASVSETLAWWLVAMPEDDRKIFLASQIFEEVKHAEFFALCFKNVFGNVDTRAYLNPAYRGVLVDELRARGEAIGRAVLACHMGRDESRENDGRAAADVERALVLGMAHYMGIIEGTLAVTGYDYFDEMLASRGIFPRLLEGVRLIRADEGRHIAHGMDYLRRKLDERPEYKDAVGELFFEESLRSAARADYIFEVNGFGLDPGRMIALSFEHLGQRSREIGLS